MSFNDMVKMQREKNRRISKFDDWDDDYDDNGIDLTPKEIEWYKIVKDCCQVGMPELERRSDGDVYFLFSYYDGDPEYYFEDFNIQQDTANNMNIINLSAVARNPPF